MREREDSAENQKPQKVCIRLYFTPNDPTKGPRLENVRFIISTNYGTVESEIATKQQKTEVVTFIANFPSDRNLKGWRFDHMLNTSFDADTSCAGAGEVNFID